MESNYSTSFDAVIGLQPRILILGTLPGKESLRKQQYYGHPRNVFWRIIFDLFGECPKEAYSDRLHFAKQHHFALWDVCYSAYRSGSLDVDIKKERPNRIVELLEHCPSITHIVFNGQKAQVLYDKYFERKGGIRYDTLLSTSPANAAYTYAQKLENWKQILD